MLDAMLVLPASMEQRFIHAISLIEEEYNMTYVNTIERVALRRGREEGLKEGKREAVSDILATQIARKRSEEQTSELQSLMRISYDVFCLKKTKTDKKTNQTIPTKTPS